MFVASGNDPEYDTAYKAVCYSHSEYYRLRGWQLGNLGFLAAYEVFGDCAVSRYPGGSHSDAQIIAAASYKYKNLVTAILAELTMAQL